MSRQIKPKWKYIIVLDSFGHPQSIYELDERQRIKQKLPKQPKRSHAELMRGITERETFPLLPFHHDVNFILPDSTDYEEEEEAKEIPFPSVKDS